MRAWLLTVLAVLLSNGIANATDCTYRYWASSVTPFDGQTYGSLNPAASPWAPTILNDYAFYTGTASPDPASGTERKWMRVPVTLRDGNERSLLVQWVERKHAVRSDEAVIVINGNSITSGAWFSDSLDAQGQPTPYTNYAGSQMYTDGFDVFAPFATHHTRFQDAQSRLASAYGEDFGSLGVRRVVAMFRHVKALGYSRIHLVGTSGGGWYAVLASRALSTDPALGMALAIEGWYSTQKIAELEPDKLFASGWEASFGRRAPYSDFVAVPQNAYFAYGSCNAASYAPDHDRLAASRVHAFDGAHEFDYATFQWALNKWREDFGLASPPPPVTPPANDQYTVVYLPLDVDLTDSNAGGAAKTFTASGGASVYSGSLLLGPNGLSSFISTPDHSDFALAAQDITLEGIWRFTSVAQDSTQGHNLVSQRGATFGWSFYHWDGGWEFAWSTDGQTIQSVRWLSAITTGQDYAIKLTRSGGTVELSVNGTPLGTRTIAGSIFDTDAPLRIGGDGANSGGTNGRVKNFALAVGIAR